MAQVISCLSGRSLLYVTLYDTCNYRALITNNRLNRKGPLISHYNVTRIFENGTWTCCLLYPSLSANSNLHTHVRFSSNYISYNFHHFFLSNDVLICLSNDRWQFVTKIRDPSFPIKIYTIIKEWSCSHVTYRCCNNANCTVS